MPAVGRIPAGSGVRWFWHRLVGPVLFWIERLFGPKLYASSVDYPFLVTGHVMRRLEARDIDGAIAYARRIHEADARDPIFALIVRRLANESRFVEARALLQEIDGEDVRQTIESEIEVDGYRLRTNRKAM